jgi:hypothetical protein
MKALVIPSQTLACLVHHENVHHNKTIHYPLLPAHHQPLYVPLPACPAIAVGLAVASGLIPFIVNAHSCVGLGVSVSVAVTVAVTMLEGFVKFDGC